MSDKIVINQIELVSAIATELQRQNPDVAIVANPRQFNAIIDAANKIVDEFEKPTMLATHGMGLDRWFKTDDTGLSSLFLAHILSGKGRLRYAHPRDIDDLGRCFRLMKAAPELRQSLARIKSHGPAWDMIVENFDHWETLYDTGHSKELEADFNDKIVKTGLISYFPNSEPE